MALDQVFGENGLLLIEVEVLDLNFVPKLLRQILSFDDEVPFLEVIQLLSLLVVNRKLKEMPSVVLENFGLVCAVALLSEWILNMRHLIAHHSIAVHCLKRALHQLATL